MEHISKGNSLKLFWLSCIPSKHFFVMKYERDRDIERQSQREKEIRRELFRFIRMSESSIGK